VFTATACADFLSYDPLYTLDVSSRLEFGDLACFTFLALIGVKCGSELFWPSSKVAASKSPFGRP
jgi:hypothetical protein